MYTCSDSETLSYPSTDAHSIIQNCLECPNNSRWSFYSTFLPHSTCLCCSLHQSLFSLSPSLISLVCPSVAMLLGQQYFCCLFFSCMLFFVLLFFLSYVSSLFLKCLTSVFSSSFTSANSVCSSYLQNSLCLSFFSTSYK